MIHLTRDRELHLLCHMDESNEFYKYTILEIYLSCLVFFCSLCFHLLQCVRMWECAYISWAHFALFTFIFFIHRLTRTYINLQVTTHHNVWSFSSIFFGFSLSLLIYSVYICECVWVCFRSVPQCQCEMKNLTLQMITGLKSRQNILQYSHL